MQMGLLDKVVAAVTPEASDKDRADAHARARAASGGSGWLAMALDHHELIEAAFASVKEAASTSARREAQKDLALLLTGHSNAEEAVLYPAMALSDQKGHASSAYTEQSAAKVQLAALDDLDPMSDDYLDKLEHLRAAVMHHVFEEESEWFPKLKGAGDSSSQSRMSRRFREEFERYMNRASTESSPA
jgi:hemerythrin superfamily protein